ncbi:hypothetical protein IFM89_000699 [Coptis chinensis]|uniref:DYW domain-containing protein n=1 Tax=Coptis chinensis TaxID=261450 RepID=A0A835HC67_9MAGN|nr:hypothetical protein IFM89_000699 [Coptis chinensis]
MLFDSNPVKNVISWNAMIDGYCKLNQFTIARELFDHMGFLKNTVTWNTMISGYVQHREFGRAISTFQDMQAESVKPTVETMVSLLSACAHLGALDMGYWIHGYIRRQKLKVDVYLGNALVDMYCKCGSLESALDVFHRLSVKNVFCWSSLIVGLGMHGYGKQAIDAFVEMQKEGIKPDRVAFIGLLSGCSHSGLVYEGGQYFSQMHGVYGIKPGIEHYGCMVDLLGRSGLLTKALELIWSMPIAPNAAVWGSLLRSCQLHKDTKLSEQVTEHLLKLDPVDGGNYVFIEWCSSIEVGNVIHEFVAGDTSHPQFAQINTFLEELAKKLSGIGHKPDMTFVLHDINEEEKETSVRHHSEKIAVAFGLMSTPEGKSIRVVKNLRSYSVVVSNEQLEVIDEQNRTIKKKNEDLSAWQLFTGIN